MARLRKPKRNHAPGSHTSEPRTAPEPTPSAPAHALLLAWSVLACLVLLAYRYVFRLGFGNDDYIILEEVALRPVSMALAWTHLIAGYWRPWSREFHFWATYRLFGVDATAFHLANVVIWLGVLASVLALVRRLTDARTAVLVVAGAFAASAWGIYLAWACCAQDLWMLLFGTLFLHAQISNRKVLAPLALAMALLSKETGVLMLPICAWTQFTRRGRAGMRARDWIGPVLVASTWVVLHPSFGGRWFFGSGARLEPSPMGPASAAVLRFLLAPLNLEHWPEPRGGWGRALVEGALWAAALGTLAWSMVRNAPAKGGAFPQRGQWIRLGLGWWAIAWSPFAISVFAWHSYYGWFGICGAWLAGVAWLSPRPRILVALLVAVSALRPAAVDTYGGEWATEIYQRLAGERTDRIRDQMLALHPTLPHHARVFIAGIPSGTGVLTSPRYSVAMRVWYRDTTITLAGLSQYWKRSPGEPSGPDYFCVMDRDVRLFPLADGSITVPDSISANSVWPVSEEKVGAIVAGAGDLHRAMGIFARLAVTYPDTARYAYDLGVLYDNLGDPARARVWLNRADSIVGVPASRGRGFLQP